MTEKYKIYLSKSIKQRLMGDAALFEFLKADQTVNLNAFLRTLIVNYFDCYRSRELQKHDRISGLLSSAGMNKESADKLAFKLRQEMMTSPLEEESLNESVTLTVGRDSCRTMKIIEDNFLVNEGMSEYMRGMFSSYLSMPRSQRESIVFKQTYDDLARAVKLKREVTFSIKTNPDVKFTVYPFAVSASVSEQNNYLVCYDPQKKTTRSFRLSRLQNVFVKDDTFTIPESFFPALKLAVEQGPQFAFSSLRRSCVRLTEEGVRKYKMIYTNRPAVLWKNGDKYYFEWPISQLQEYFKRFGEDAVILEPIEARRAMCEYYANAVAAYNSQLD